MENMLMVNGKETITSLELLEQINIFRGQESRKELAHKTLLRTIEDEFEDEITENKFVPSQYKDQSGKQNKMYILTLSQAKQVLVRESKFVRKAVIHYIELLEEQLKQQLPMSPVEAYLAMSEEDRAIAYFTKVKEDKEKALLLEQQAPKVSYFDKFIDTNTTFTSTQVAKVYGISSARKLNMLLKEKHIIYKQGKTWLVYETTNKKWFKDVLNEFGTQLRFTALGVVEVAKLLDVELNEDAIKEAE